MKTEQDTHVLSTLQVYVNAASSVSIIIGIAVLSGWLLDIAVLKSLVPGLATMKANTAISFALVGFALWLGKDEQADPLSVRVRQVCGGLVLLLGILTLGEYTLGKNFGIDQLIFNDPQTSAFSFPGRMSITTALDFTLIAGALILLNVERKQGFRPSQYLALIAGSIALLALIGYMYNVQALYRVGAYSSMALPTAINFVLLAVGILFVRPDRGWIKIIMSETIGGAIVRRLLPLAIGLPIVIGWLGLLGQRFGLYDTKFGLALIVILRVAVLTAIVWLNAKWLNRVDADRRRAEEVLRGSENRFRLIVETAPSAMISVDREGRINLVNARAQELFGYSREELLERPVEILVPERFRNGHTRDRQGFINQPTNRAMRVGRDLFGVHKDGHEIPIEIGLSSYESADGFSTLALIVDISARKQAQAQNNFHASLLRHINDAVIATDVDVRITAWNRAAERMYGWTLEEAMGRNVAEIMSSGLTDVQRAEAVERLKEGSTSRTERIHHRKDGQPIWVEANTIVLTDEHGSMNGYVSVNRDITERKRIEEALKMNERRFRALVENSGMLINLINREGVLTYVSPSSAYVVGFTPKEMVGRKVVEFLHPDEVHDKERPLPNMFRSPGSVVKSERRVRHKDGTWRWVEGYSTNLLDDPAVGALVFNYRDITDRKQAEEALLESEERYRTLIEQALDGIFVADPQGSYTDVNSSGCAMLGYTREELLKLTLHDVIDPDDLAAYPLRLKELQEGETLLVERKLRRKDGSTFFAELSAKMLPRGYYQAMVRNITERKRAEERQNFLANASRALASSLDFETTLTTVAQLAVPRIADWCTVYLATPDGIEQVALTHADPEKVKWALELQRRFPPNPNAPRGVAQVIRSGQAEFTPEIPAELLEPLTRDPEMSKLLDELQLTGAMTVPLALHGQTLGAISLVSAESRLRYTLDDLELAEELARRMAVAVENARLYHTAQQLNEELEQRVVKRTAQLQESEEKFSKAFLASPAAISIASALDGRYMDVNDTLAKLTGYSREELIGHTSLELGLVDATEREKILHSARERGFVRDVEIQVHTKSNQFVDVLVSTEQIMLNGQPCMLTIQHDITERKRAEAEVRWLNQELENNQKDIQSILDSMATLNAKVALDGRLLFVNKIATQASGLAVDELMKTNFLEGQWWTFDPKVQTRVKDAFAKACSGTVINYDEKIFVFGQILTISFSLTPMFGSDGRVEYILAEGRDISKLKDAEESLRIKTTQLEVANKELESFAYSVSHDLRAPLRAINGFSQALLNKYTDSLEEQGQHYLSRIQANTRHMGQLIDDLLSLSRISRREMKQDNVNLTELAYEIDQELRAQEPERQVMFEVESQLEARGDTGLIRIVLQNLLSNAWKFTAARQPARIQFGISPRPHPPGRGDGGEGERVYYIRDDGVGFDMAYTNKLFGAFQRLHSTAEFPGTGIGLATVQRIIHRHGGRVWAEAELEKGATFYFTLGGNYES